MFQRLAELLSNKKLILFSGIVLLISFILSFNDSLQIPDPAWIPLIICGYPLVFMAIERLIHNQGIKKISSALLITIAMVAAIWIGDVFAAAEVAFIMSIGEMLEDLTTERAQKGLHNLIKLTPTMGRVLRDNQETMTPVEQINVGDRLRILPGEQIPVDGKVVEGQSSINQSILTGESLPIDKALGDEVFSGTINCEGVLEIETTKASQNSSIQKLIQLIEQARNDKAPTERQADLWASWLVPLALLIAIVTYLLTHQIERAVTVLVVFCPCALVLATPTAIMAAIGQATQHGVIIKSGTALESMAKVDTLAFDKTGTLTHGKLKVSDLYLFNDKLTENQFLQYVASIENYSEHPIGKAILNHVKSAQLSLLPIENFKLIPGKGLQAEVDQEPLYCGNLDYIKSIAGPLTAEQEKAYADLSQQGKACVFVAMGNQCVGFIGLNDQIRQDAPQVVSQLTDMGLQTLLLSGDNQRAVSHQAAKIGVSCYKAELLPQDKMATLKELQEEHKSVAMVGDGFNDAPALEIANVGIAMAKIGSDLAIDAADIALITDDLSRLPYLKRLANATLSTIKFGISLSLLINFCAIYFSVNGMLTPTTGALVHNAGSCFVVFIAALLYDRKFDTQKAS